MCTNPIKLKFFSHLTAKRSVRLKKLNFEIEVEIYSVPNCLRQYLMIECWLLSVQKQNVQS